MWILPVIATVLAALIQQSESQTCNNYRYTYYSYSYYYNTYYSSTSYNSYNLCAGQYCSTSSSCQSGSCYLASCDISSYYSPTYYYYTYYTYYYSAPVNVGAIIGAVVGVIIVIVIIAIVCRQMRHKRLAANLHHQYAHDTHQPGLVINYQAPLVQDHVVAPQYPGAPAGYPGYAPGQQPPMYSAVPQQQMPPKVPQPSAPGSIQESAPINGNNNGQQPPSVQVM